VIIPFFRMSACMVPDHLLSLKPQQEKRFHLSHARLKRLLTIARGNIGRKNSYGIYNKVYTDFITRCILICRQHHITCADYVDMCVCVIALQTTITYIVYLIYIYISLTSFDKFIYYTTRRS